MWRRSGELGNGPEEAQGGGEGRGRLGPSGPTAAPDPVSQGPGTPCKHTDRWTATPLSSQERAARGFATGWAVSRSSRLRAGLAWTWTRRPSSRPPREPPGASCLAPATVNEPCGCLTPSSTKPQILGGAESFWKERASPNVTVGKEEEALLCKGMQQDPARRPGQRAPHHPA